MSEITAEQRQKWREWATQRVQGRGGRRAARWVLALLDALEDAEARIAAAEVVLDNVSRNAHEHAWRLADDLSAALDGSES